MRWRAKNCKAAHQSVQLCGADLIGVHHAKLSPGYQVQAKLSETQNHIRQMIHKWQNTELIPVLVCGRTEQQREQTVLLPSLSFVQKILPSIYFLLHLSTTGLHRNDPLESVIKWKSLFSNQLLTGKRCTPVWGWLSTTGKQKGLKGKEGENVFFSFHFNPAAWSGKRWESSRRSGGCCKCEREQGLICLQGGSRWQQKAEKQGEKKQSGGS